MFEQLNQTRQELEQSGHYSVEKKKPLEPEPIDLQTMTFDDNFMLDTDQSSDDEDLDLVNVAKNHFDQEAQEKIEDALVETLHVEVVESRDCWNQAFFKHGNKVNTPTNSLSIYLFLLKIIHVEYKRTIIRIKARR